MPPIDLTLAVNYIPAVVCLAKAVLISFCLSLLNPGHYYPGHYYPGTQLGGFNIFALLLNIDRAVSCARIFDENAVQLCILAAWVINYLRGAVEEHRFLNPIVSFLWIVFSLSLVLEPKKVQELFVLYGQGSGGIMHKLIPAMVTSAMVAVICFTPMAPESGIIKSGRTVGFACLCVAWVYIVSVWKAKPRHAACVFETHALIARFCPVLYVNWMLAVGFVVACLVCLVYHYVLLHVWKEDIIHIMPSIMPSIMPVQATVRDVRDVRDVSDVRDKRASSITPLPVDVGMDVTGLDMIGLDMIGLDMIGLDVSSTIEEEDEEMLEAYFRSACQSKLETA